MKNLIFKFQQNRTINEHFDFFEGKRGGGGGWQYLSFILNYYWYTYENVAFQISAKFEWGGVPIYKFQSQLLWANMKVFSFKIQQIRIINEKFDFC